MELPDSNEILRAATILVDREKAASIGSAVNQIRNAFCLKKADPESIPKIAGTEPIGKLEQAGDFAPRLRKLQSAYAALRAEIVHQKRQHDEELRISWQEREAFREERNALKRRLDAFLGGET